MAAKKKASKNTKTEVNMAPEAPMKNKKMGGKKLTYIVLVVIILAGLAYLLRSMFVAAMVDGKPIWRMKVVRNLEKRQGADVLDALVTEKVVLAEAKKQGVEISQDDVASKVKELEDTLTAQGQSLDALLAQEGVTRTELEDQVKLQLAIEKLLQKEISVSDEDVDGYIETYKDSFLKDVAEENLRDEARKQLIQQKMSERFQGWLDELKAAANIRYWVDY